MYFNIPSIPVVDTCKSYSSFNCSKVFFREVKSFRRLLRVLARALEATAFTILDLNSYLDIASPFYFSKLLE
jgi:hypothetical protein